jgi:hypothetical protein
LPLNKGSGQIHFQENFLSFAKFGDEEGLENCKQMSRSNPVNIKQHRWRSYPFSQNASPSTLQGKPT